MLEASNFCGPFAAEPASFSGEAGRQLGKFGKDSGAGGFGMQPQAMPVPSDKYDWMQTELFVPRAASQEP